MSSSGAPRSSEDSDIERNPAMLDGGQPTIRDIAIPPRLVAVFGEALPELLDQMPADVEIGSVTAPRGYDARKCHDAVAVRGAHAVMAPRKNAKPWKPTTAGAIARSDALRVLKNPGRAIRRNWGRSRRGSSVETTPVGTAPRDALPVSGSIA
jgi:hypothetical protein